MAGMSLTSRVARYHTGLPQLTPRMLRHPLRRRARATRRVRRGARTGCPWGSCAGCARTTPRPRSPSRWLTPFMVSAWAAPSSGSRASAPSRPGWCASRPTSPRTTGRSTGGCTATGPVVRTIGSSSPLPGKLAAPIRPLRGSMGECAPGSSGRSESRPPAVHSFPPEADPATSSRPSCSAGVAPVPADVLLDLVWSEQAATLDVAAVHTVVARLRRQFGAELIDREHGGYLVPDAVRTDVDEVLLRRSQARACTAQRDWSGRRQADRAALSLWGRSGGPSRVFVTTWWSSSGPGSPTCAGGFSTTWPPHCSTTPKQTSTKRTTSPSS
jgi:hypothetical protein